MYTPSCAQVLHVSFPVLFWYLPKLHFLAMNVVKLEKLSSNSFLVD